MCSAGRSRSATPPAGPWSPDVRGTQVPEPCRDTTKPVARSSSRAATTVERLTPRATARDRSGGKLTPASSRPLEILDRMACARRRPSGPLPRSRHPSTRVANRVAPIVSDRSRMDCACTVQ